MSFQKKCKKKLEKNSVKKNIFFTEKITLKKTFFSNTTLVSLLDASYVKRYLAKASSSEATSEREETQYDYINWVQAFMRHKQANKCIDNSNALWPSED